MSRLLRNVAVAALLLGSLAPAAAGPALLFDAKDGRILYAEDHDHVWHPASLTKIMTAYMTFEAIKAGKLALDTRIPASELAHAQQPSKVGLPVGATMTVELALQALIVKSANDVAVMLAEAISGSVDQFAADMNAAARRMGMTHTNFVNPHGLPAPEQVTTARDLGRLAMVVLREYPQYAALWNQPDMRIGKRRLRTHNGLLRTYDGADGLKTGFICDSGYNVVASASRDGRRVVAVVLGEPSGAARTLRAAGLLEHGFETADWRGAVGPAHTLATLPVPADAKSVPVSVRGESLNRDCNPRRRAVPQNTAAKVKAQREAMKKSAGETPDAGAAKSAPKPAPQKSTPSPASQKPAAAQKAATQTAPAEPKTAN
jgi:D-alanyl-D-alanine carboxypeptidase